MKENMVWIKAALICCLVIFMASMLMVGQHDSKTVISDMENKILAEGDLGTMLKSNSQMVKKIFGLNDAEYEGIVYYQGSGVMDVSELLIVKLKSDSQADTVEKAMQGRVEAQIQNFTNYGTNQIDLLKSYEIRVVGNYCFYAVSENASQLREIFSKSL